MEYKLIMYYSSRCGDDVEEEQDEGQDVITSNAEPCHTLHCSNLFIMQSSSRLSR